MSDHRRRGCLQQQPQQDGSGFAPTHPAERASRFLHDDPINVVEQFDDHRNGRRRRACTAAAAGADLWRVMSKQWQKYITGKTDAQLGSRLEGIDQPWSLHNAINDNPPYRVRRLAPTDHCKRP